MRFPPRFLDDLKGRVSIYDYAGRRIAWDKAKSRPSQGDYWASCPFHSEKTASFHVRDRQGTYKCFGCGESGDLFGLCMQLEGVSFPEAVQHLAQFAGVALPEGEAGPSKAQVDARQRLFSAMEKAAAYFRSKLMSAAGAPARAYLTKRGLPQEVWVQFGIGFAPEGWSTAYEALTASGFKGEELFAAGLAKQGQKGPIDIFRNRIMFPIADAQGRIVAFGGRAMDPNDNAKYLNSPETELFHKGRTLYRLAEARRTLSKTKGGGLIIAEGYMDVIAFERAGLPAVAPLGTALTEDQLMLAWRSGAEPVLCFDGDGAGQRAAGKSLDVALPHLSPDKTVRFAVLSGGLDPDDLFQKEGPKALAALIEAAVPAATFLFTREKARKELTTPEARAGLKRRLKEACGVIVDPDTRASYLKDMLAQADAAIRDVERPARPQTPAQAGPRAAAGKGRFGQGGGRGGFEPAVRATEALKSIVGQQRRSAVEDALILAADRPALLDRGGDRLALLPIADPALDAIRHALLDLWSAGKAVDRAALSVHLQHVQEDRAHARVVNWPPPVAPRRARSRELEALEGANPPPAPPPGPRPADADLGAIEAEWMALLEHVMARPGLEEDLDAVKAAAVRDDDAEAFARAVALLKARRDADARALPSAVTPDPTTTDDQSQNAA